MAGEWPPVCLEDLVEVKHGFAFQGEFFSDEPPGDVLLTPGNFSIGGGFKGDKFKYYRGPVPDDFVLTPGDLLVTMTDLSKASDTLGYPALVPKAKIRFLHNQRIGKIEIKPNADLDIDFLYYLLCTREYRNEVLASATGTTVKHTSPTRIGKFRFRRPSLDEQQAIAYALRVLDDKIELNRKMNETLEAMARALFKSWFVDFDPVRAKAEGRDPGLPAPIAALFPDSFEDSELGEIPKGWSVAAIRDVASNIQYGLTASAQTEGAGPKFLRITDIQEGRVDWSKVPYCNAPQDQFDRYQLKPHDIFVARTGASTGENVYLPVVPDAVFASYLVRFQFKEPAHARLIGAFMRSSAYFEYVRNSIGGSAQPNASAQVLAGVRLVIPPLELCRKYAKILAPFDQSVWQNLAESEIFGELRDALLPKLISGELRVPEAAVMIKGVA